MIATLVKGKTYILKDIVFKKDIPVMVNNEIFEYLQDNDIFELEKVNTENKNEKAAEQQKIEETPKEKKKRK